MMRSGARASLSPTSSCSMTAKVDTRDIVNGLEAGGDDYITKPYEQTVVVARIRSMLRIKELHEPCNCKRHSKPSDSRIGTARLRSRSPSKSQQSSGSTVCGDFCRRKWRR